jgi:hypothetical protein
VSSALRSSPKIQGGMIFSQLPAGARVTCCFNTGQGGSDTLENAQAASPWREDTTGGWDDDAAGGSTGGLGSEGCHTLGREELVVRPVQRELRVGGT